MRTIAVVTLLLAGAASSALAQSASPDAFTGDVAVTYQWVRSNTQPADCGCFSLNGGGASASLNLHHSLAAVAEISGGFAGNGPSTGNSLTLISYMGGARYLIRSPWSAGAHRPEPFAQVLVGAAHASGGIAGDANGATAFAGRIGGGIDLPLTSRIAARLIQIDYYATQFANSANNHQNNLLVGTGLTIRWLR